MNIDEDDFSDDDDFMDDDDEERQGARRRTRTQAKQPKLKYADLLQKVADRYEEQITIDLDDLAKVLIARPTKQINTNWMQYDEALEESGTLLNLVSSIENNTKHFLDIFCRAVDKVMPDPTREIK